MILQSHKTLQTCDRTCWTSGNDFNQVHKGPLPHQIGSKISIAIQCKQTYIQFPKGRFKKKGNVIFHSGSRPTSLNGKKAWSKNVLNGLKQILKQKMFFFLQFFRPLQPPKPTNLPFKGEARGLGDQSTREGLLKTLKVFV